MLYNHNVYAKFALFNKIKQTGCSNYMKNSFFYNLIRATGIYIFITALLHIIILLIVAIRNCDFSMFNYFSVLDAQLFFPGIDNGKISYIISLLLSFSLIGLIFFIITKKEKK